MRTYQVIWILCCILALFGCAQTSPQALTTTTPKTFSQSKAELKKAYIAQNFIAGLILIHTLLLSCLRKIIRRVEPPRVRTRKMCVPSTLNLNI
ncbi:Hypothetical protein BN2458_PEG1950 [Helicobacter typhlonius]|uniref:Lipoprotein n=1 Tax=Helicobacter typhlonius TaxID=76936 RepID=A0A0S4PXR6_9HELI|nr:Hypothetical protein BN2458_PEG1950 [Helicobacter typhlonius]